MGIKIGKDKFETIEKYFFLLVIGLNLIPILAFKFFPSLDGVAHLYNSNLIPHLFLQNEDFKEFFVFNQEPVPNWTGHFMLSFFNLFLPAFMAEKILLMFYMIGLPLSFRAFIKTIAPDNIIFSYFIFPFTYSFTFYLGFYNFSIALVFMFIVLNYWIRHEGNFLSLGSILKLFLLISFTYFSHILIFALLLLLIGMYVLIQALNQIILDRTKIRETIIVFYRKTGVLFLSSFIPLLLFCYYFISRPTPAHKIYLSATELMHWLINLRPIIVFNVLEEEVYTKKIVYIVLLLLILGIYNKIKGLGLIKNSLKEKMRFLLANQKAFLNYWLLATMAFLLLYFNVHDSDDAAGFVSVRLGLLFFFISDHLACDISVFKMVYGISCCVCFIFKFQARCLLFESH